MIIEIKTKPKQTTATAHVGVSSNDLVLLASPSPDMFLQWTSSENQLKLNEWFLKENICSFGNNVTFE